MFSSLFVSGQIYIIFVLLTLNLSNTFMQPLNKINQRYCRGTSRPLVLYATTIRSIFNDDSTISTTQNTASTTEPPITVLDHGDHHVVVSKPPSVICHHSDWAGSRSRKYGTEPEIPMLQRVRDGIGRRVNLIHRLDRACSGCLLFAFEDSENATKVLNEAMATASKTYVAIVRGEGILHGRDFKKEGWFEVDRPIKDESGKLNNATTEFLFVAGQGYTSDRPRASLVLARPKTGRWHQIRRHLNGLSHPILGDTMHGNSKVNRDWKENRGMLPERTCLHLAHLRLTPTEACPDGIDVKSPLAPDMVAMLRSHLPDVLREAQPVLERESILIP